MPISNDSTAGVVNPVELYTITALKRRLGIQDATLRAARRTGLPVHYAHKQAFVIGKDWIDHVVNSGQSSNDQPISNG
jgi:hypothetical protein